MKGSKAGNCAVTNSVTKKIIELKTPVFVTRYSIDDKYDLQMKINRGEISFDKFEEFDYFIRDVVLPHTDIESLLINGQYCDSFFFSVRKRVDLSISRMK